MKHCAAVFAAAIAVCLPAMAADLEVPDIETYREIDGRTLEAHVFAPVGKPSGAAILLFHGGGWSVGEPQWVYPAARRFAALGLTAVAVEYRLSDKSVTPADALSDTCAAFAWVRQRADELGLDVGRVAGYGVSAGGQLVAAAATVGCEEVGAAGGPNALLLWSPAVDVGRDRWFERLLQGEGEATDYSPADHVQPGAPPTSIVQGDKDTLTPLSGVDKFCDEISEVGGRCDLHVYQGLGHLLTRNLANQESDFDPDPAAKADGMAQLDAFLADIGYTTAR
ncbi:MAG: alpha/beta hydrolase [Acidobacteriota bacterium]